MDVVTVTTAKGEHPVTPDATTKHVRAKKKAPARKGAKSKKTPTNDSKTAIVLGLLRRKQGVTMPELIEATGWQVHSVRGFLSGTIRKKMGLTVESSKEGDQRSYSIRD
jgi:hypothetical protein